MRTAQPDLSDLFPCTSLRLVLVFKHGFEIQLAYFFRIAGLIEWLSHLEQISFEQEAGICCFLCRGGGHLLWIMRWWVPQFPRMWALGSPSAVQVWHARILGIVSHLGSSYSLKPVAALTSSISFSRCLCSQGRSLLISPGVTPLLATSKQGSSETSYLERKGYVFFHEHPPVFSLKSKFNSWVFWK